MVDVHIEYGPITLNVALLLKIRSMCNSNVIQKPMLGPAANAPFQTDSSLDPA